MCRTLDDDGSLWEPWWCGLHKYPTRYDRNNRRPPPLWMHLNMMHGLCWCGKKKRRADWNCCSPTHTAIWNVIAVFWTSLREHVLYGINTPKKTSCEHLESGHEYCVECKQFVYEEYYWKCVVCGTGTNRPEVDHVVAKCNGGDPWDEANLRILCHECHTVKTADDMRLLRRSRKNLTSLDSWLRT